MPRFTRPKPKSKERRREFVACIGLLALFGCLFAAGLVWNTSRTASATSQAQAAAQLEATLRSGPILFVPLTGNVCRQRVIDNETWRIRDAGEVICDEAVSWNATVPLNTYSVTSRLQALQSVFSTRQGSQ
jgi:hypothetical protein